jgi:hypothetical protein
MRNSVVKYTGENTTRGTQSSTSPGVALRAGRAW